MPLWLLGFALALSVTTASAQQDQTGNSPSLKSGKTRNEATSRETKKLQAETIRPLSEIDDDIRKIKLQIDEKKKIAGSNVLPYEEKLEKLENERKIAKNKLSGK